MLIAAKCTREAELFKTALFLIASGNKVPEDIKTFLTQVLKQAKEILVHPEAITPDIIPEAIDLALEFQMIANLSENFNSIENIDSLSKDQASNILEKMEYCPVC